ncbi:hypothetical protein CDL15_Pgr019962 [Punica granatum]|uniref:Inositol polyphosphate-related phosphatase domain-containing protein n=1 Tax=Punica granatum TaxID=22663 RepID=A0A218VR39_PUNGR|nr:hypothetical protein CDL15_Pgr019962 [Punica granatum]
MWPKLVVNKFLRNSMGSNNFVADLPADCSSCFDDHNHEYSSLLASVKHFNRTDQETFEIFVSSWNVGGVAPPEDLDLEDWLNLRKSPADIYVFGFQEIVPLSAGNVLGSENSKISLKWNRIIKAALHKPRPLPTVDHSTEKDQQGSITGDCPQGFQCVISKQMVGIFISVWARSDLCKYIEHPNISCVGCGIMGWLGNKGSVSVRFLLHETSFCFVCSHLASGGREGDERHRNSDAAEILLRSGFPAGPQRNLPSKILDHDRVIWLGDLNYRIHLPDSTTRALVERRKWNVLLENDQLKAELMKGRIFRGWQEGVIKFAPTYKYYPNSEVYYGCSEEIQKSKKFRAPAWCDRIIWFGEGLKQSLYDRGECKLSDHRPVRAIFSTEVESFHNSSGFKCFLSGRIECFKSIKRTSSDELSVASL